ncbi:SWIM zinc finger family protein [Egbenema bharatensis]|uniref:SWIM zinc finger family protein n=1 Tax=Egbenema bharatensis TaxID=3463334 RepID=UPI003A8C853B
MASPLADILTRDRLLDLAGDLYFQRGEDYFRRGQVGSLAEYDGVLTAQVAGTEEYRVQLWVEGEELDYDCTCPLGAEGACCKHCVAVGLTWLRNPEVIADLAEGDVAAPVPRKRSSRMTTMEDVATYLKGLNKDDLVKMVIDRAMDDAQWQEALIMKAATRAERINIKTFERALRNAIRPGSFIGYYEAYSYAEGVSTAFDSLEDLLEAGYAQEVMELCEYTFPLFEESLNSVDDSDGHMTPLMEQLQELHYRACLEVKPDPETLAERLFEGEMQSGFGMFDSAINTYAAVLGKRGIDRYRQLVEAEWEKLPPLNASQSRASFSSARWQLTRMMENLAQQSQDLEALIAIKKRDLSRPANYLAIAKLYQQTGEPDQALEWAEQGMQTFPDRPDAQLREFLVEEYERRGRFDQAIDLIWNAFKQMAHLGSYQRLKEQAEKHHDWAEWRDRALSYVREQVASGKQQRTSYGYSLHDHSTLVEIFLWEGNPEQAWIEAQAGGCSQKLWFKLAELRKADHPEEVLPIYQKQVEPLIQQTNNQAYADAVEFLRKSRELMVRLDRAQEFEQWVAHLQRTYKAKRNFMKLVKQAGWG